MSCGINVCYSGMCLSWTDDGCGTVDMSQLKQIRRVSHRSSMPMCTYLGKGTGKQTKCRNVRKSHRQNAPSATTMRYQFARFVSCGPGDHMYNTFVLMTPGSKEVISVRLEVTMFTFLSRQRFIYHYSHQPKTFTA